MILVRSSGTPGLVAAGCVSMLLRVGYCTWYARGYFREATFPLSSVLPTPLGLASLAVDGRRVTASFAASQAFITWKPQHPTLRFLCRLLSCSKDQGLSFERIIARLTTVFVFFCPSTDCITPCLEAVIVRHLMQELVQLILLFIIVLLLDGLHIR